MYKYLGPPRPTYAEFQLQCQTTGVVKAYKMMTTRTAKERNRKLASQQSLCRWVQRREHRNAAEHRHLAVDCENRD